MSEAKFEPGEGGLMSELTPHPPSLCSGTLSHKGRGETEFAARDPRLALNAPSGVDLTFATHLTTSSTANVKS
jgi:hypothetical protein